MIRASRSLLLVLGILIAVALTPRPISGQVATGTPPFGSFAGGPDVINLGNLNVHYTILVIHKPGRGTDFGRDITYDSAVWTPVSGSGSQSWTPSGSYGWTLSPNGQTYITYSVTYTTGNCGYQGQSSYQEWIFSNFTYYDQFGVSTVLGGGSDYYNSPGGTTCPPAGPQPPTPQPVSAGGYTLYASPGPGSASGYIYDKYGTKLFPTFTSNPSGQQTPFMSIDRNGNEITSSGGVYTDTLNTAALTIAGTAPSNTTFTYTAPSGATPAYTVSYKSYVVRTNFGCTSVTEYNTARTLQPYLVDRVTLPDGSFYQINYETTYGDTHSPHDVTGRISSVTLPTGGAISYKYASDGSGKNSVSCSDGTSTVLVRSTPDTGSTSCTYSRSQVSGNHWQTAITDPNSFQTTIDFQEDTGTTYNFYETLRSNSLETVTTCYNANTSNCSTTSVAFPITQQNVTTQLGTQQALRISKYNTTGGLTEEDDYDYATGTPTVILKKTIITYASLTNINAFQQQVTVCNGIGTASACNGTGTVVSQTSYNYDETAPTGSSGTLQHVAVTGSRGNLTSITYPTGTNSQSKNTYYDTGMLLTATDSNGAVLTYSYAGSSCYNAFPTKVTEPLSMSRSFAWNCNGGVMTTLTDENSQATTTAYNDPYFWRPASQSFPDTGLTSWGYSAYSITNGPATVTTTRKMNSTQSVVTTALLDGLGRTSQTQLSSDPLGTDYTATTYDSLGRLWQVYNLTRCSPPTTNCGESTYGYTAYLYDALNRVTSIRSQDGSTATASYLNNTETVTDQAGEARKFQADGLGRVTNVWEDPSGVNYQTAYTYDALGNLTGVVQGGSRNRSYTFDGLSRLTSENNPESGAVSYTYNSNGDLGTKIAPAPNQTGTATVTSTYSWDLLHRLTRKSYSDGTPTATFQFDTGSFPGGSPPANAIGRMTLASTSNTITAFSYDPLGRTAFRSVCTPINCGSGGWSFYYTYNLAGGVTQFNDGIFTWPQYFNQTYDGAGRVTLVTSTVSDAQHPATFFTSDATNGYWPTGALRKAALGNGLTMTNVYYNTLQPCLVDVNNNGTLLNTCNDGTPTGNVLDLAMNYYSNGNVSGWNATGAQSFVRTYTYDSINRVKTMADTVTAQPCKGLSWTYDAWGNRTAQTLTSGSCGQFSATVNTQNQLTDPINHLYIYDAAGNMTHDASHSYTFDAENRLTAVDGGATASYVYDALGRRVKRTVGSSSYEYIYDNDGHIGWELLNGSINRTYIRSNGYLLAEYSQGTTYFIHQDHLGSTRLLTGYPSPSIVECDDYYPFGESNTNVSSCLAASDTTLKFTGDERDTETTLDHTLFRQNSSALGRWMTPDPAGLAAVNPTSPQSWNRYAYVQNSPLSYVDPLGLSDCHPGEACWTFGSNFGGDILGGGWFDVWGGDAAVEASMFGGFAARTDYVQLPGNRCFETIGDYICTNTANGDFWFYAGRGIGSGKYYLQANSDCGIGGDRQIDYHLVQQTNGQVTPVADFTVQEHVQNFGGPLFNAGTAQTAAELGYSGYLDYITGTGTRDTWQSFIAWPQGGPQISVFARDVYGRDYGTNGIYVQGAQGPQPAQIFVNGTPTPPGRSCVQRTY
jgi:RHS repeat-associated protein